MFKTQCSVQPYHVWFSCENSLRKLIIRVLLHTATGCCNRVVSVTIARCCTTLLRSDEYPAGCCSCHSVATSGQIGVITPLETL